MMNRLDEKGDKDVSVCKEMEQGAVGTAEVSRCPSISSKSDALVLMRKLGYQIVSYTWQSAPPH